MKQKNLWILCGAPGSGKSYFAKNILMTDNTWVYVSRDEVRYGMLKDSDKYFSKEKEVYDYFVKRIDNALHNDNISNVIADATHLHEPSRMKLLGRLRLEGINVIPIWFNTSYKTCLERNAKREGRAKVPEEVIRDMYNHSKHPKYDHVKYTAIMEVDE